MAAHTDYAAQLAQLEAGLDALAKHDAVAPGPHDSETPPVRPDWTFLNANASAVTSRNIFETQYQHSWNPQVAVGPMPTWNPGMPPEEKEEPSTMITDDDAAPFPPPRAYPFDGPRGGAPPPNPNVWENLSPLPNPTDPWKL